MALIEWSDDFKLGEAEIDKEHWGLFALIHDLADKRAKGQDAASIEATLKALVAYVDVHFEHEERLMQETGYPEYAEHKKIHEALDRKVDARSLESERSPETFDCAALMEFLSNWLSQHILIIDMEFADYLKQQKKHAS